MGEKRGHNIAELSFSDTIELLHKEGYQLNNSEGEGEYVMLYVHSSDEDDFEYFREVGYSLLHFESEEDLNGEVGVLHCGGVYTCAALFKGETNITLNQPKNYVQIVTLLPPGDSPIEFSDSDDNEEDEAVEDDEEEEEDGEEGAATKRQRGNDEDEEEDEEDED